MDYSFGFESGQLLVIAGTGLLAVGFLLYYFVAKSKRAFDLFCRFKGKWLQDTSIALFTFQKICGVLFLGVIPFFFILFFLPVQPVQLGLTVKNIPFTVLWIVGLSVPVLLLTYLGTRSSEKQKMYPQIRKKEWGIKLLLFNALMWALYLLAYEYLFRGIFIFLCLGSLGFWITACLNACFYAMAHIPKGAQESFLSIPFGILLAYLTVKSETIWIAYFVHLVMALGNSYFALQSNPEMSIVKKLKS